MTQFRWSKGPELRQTAQPIENQVPISIQTAIARCLLLSPRSTDQLIAQLKQFDVDDIQNTLRLMRDDGQVACTSERWWLRSIGLADLHKSQEKSERTLTCCCSNFVSGGVPCPTGKCPNAPRIQSR